MPLLPAALVMALVNDGSPRRMLLDRDEYRRVLSRLERHLFGHLLIALYKTYCVRTRGDGKFLDAGFSDQFPVEINISERRI